MVNFFLSIHASAHKVEVAPPLPRRSSHSGIIEYTTYSCRRFQLVYKTTDDSRSKVVETSGELSVWI